MFKRFAVALCVAALAVVAAAQETDLEKRLRELEQRVEQLRITSPSPELTEIQRQIEILTQEIEALKTRQTDKTVVADSEQYGLGAAASKVYRSEGGVSLGGYGEMLYQNVAGTNDAGSRVSSRDNFDMLRAVLNAGYKFNDRVIFNSETEFEHGSTGAGGEVSVEFAYLDFLATKNVGIRTGLLLVPMGFVNEQHEPTAFFGARRPLTERSVIPATWREMGAGAFGEHGPVSWRAYVVTGLNAARFSASGVRSGRGNGAQSLAEDFALTGRLDYAPVVGTILGASAYSGNAGQGALVNGERLDARVTLWDLHAETKFRGVSLRGLFVRGTIDEAARINQLNKLSGPGSVGESFGGWYGEAAYDLAALGRFGQHSISPFVRYEKLDTQRSVPNGFARNGANDQTLTTFGVQYKPIPQTVIKLDYQNVDNDSGLGVNQWNLGIGYIF